MILINTLKPSKDFEMVPGDVIRDMDVMSVGVYCKLLSVEGEWETSIKGLSKEFGLSEDKTRRCINTLEKTGYLKRIPKRSEDGRTLSGYDYIVLGIQAEDKDRTSPGVRHSQNQVSLISGMPENGQAWPKMANPDDDDTSIKLNNNNIINNNINIYGERTTSSAVCVSESSHPKDGKTTGDNITPAAERIYALYPSTVVGATGNKRSLKSRSSDIAKIVRVLKSGEFSEEKLTEVVRRYLAEGIPAYYQKLSTFLNNIPDYDEADALDVFTPERGGDKKNTNWQ